MYIGPDTVLPLNSVLAAVAGLVIMFWHRLAGTVKLMVHSITQTAEKR